MIVASRLGCGPWEWTIVCLAFALVHPKGGILLSSTESSDRANIYNPPNFTGWVKLWPHQVTVTTPYDYCANMRGNNLTYLPLSIYEVFINRSWAHYIYWIYKIYIFFYSKSLVWGLLVENCFLFAILRRPAAAMLAGLRVVIFIHVFMFGSIHSAAEYTCSAAIELLQYRFHSRHSTPTPAARIVWLFRVFYLFVSLLSWRKHNISVFFFGSRGWGLSFVEPFFGGAGASDPWFRRRN